jgi:hypothetical protein
MGGEMKRSEAVSIIQFYLYDSVVDDDLEKLKKDADQILTKLEEAGMLPPHHPKRMGSAWHVSSGWDDGVYEWEEE